MDLQRILNEIIAGKITERNLRLLKNVATRDSEWLTSVNNNSQVFSICDAFKDHIAKAAATSLNLQLMIFVLDAYARHPSGNSLLLMKHCLPAICQFIELSLLKIHGSMKEKEKSALQKMLSLLASLELSFALYPKSLLKRLILTIFSETTDFDEYCLIFLLSLPKTDVVSTFIVETMFEIIQNREEKFKKTFAETKIPMPFLFLIAYTQILLSQHESEAYEKAFKFTAHLIDQLNNKCCDVQHSKAFMAFAEEYLGHVLALYGDPVWPAVPFILQLITKAIFCKLIGPSTNLRLQSFLVKQIPRIAEQLKTLESRKSKDWPPNDLKTKIISYVETLPRDFIKGDIKQAYTNLWCKCFAKPFESEILVCASKIDAEQAVVALEQMKDGHATCLDCLKLLLKCSDTQNRAVKTNAVKALGKVILLEPSYLSIPKVQLVISDCLESLTASGRVSISNMFGTYLSTKPALTERFLQNFLTLLSDDAFTVRRAAVNAIGRICAVDYFLGMEVLAKKIILLFYDPEFLVQNAVVDFFLTVFVKRVNHLGCLVEINVNGNIRSTMVPMLKKLESLETLRKEEIVDDLALVAEAVVLYLKTNSEEKKRLAAAVILEALAQVYPSSLTKQFSDICKLTFSDHKEPYLKKKLCYTLISSADLMSASEKASIYSHAKLLIVKFQWETLGPCVLDLLAVLSKFATENIFDTFVRPSWEVVAAARLDDKPRRDVLLSLSIVGFLWKDCEKHGQVFDILLEYLEKPYYQMTMLMALTQARLDTVCHQANPVLNRLIRGFICDTAKPALAIAALKYLNNCLIGDEVNYEKPEMKELGDSTTAALSQILQETLQAVLACTLHPHSGIRQTACGVVRRMVQSGLLLRSHFVAYLVAMTADDYREIRCTALESLKELPETDIALFVIYGVANAYDLLKVLRSNCVVRGVGREPGNSVCHDAFQLLRSAAKVRKVLENLVMESMKFTQLEKVIFFLDNVVFYPYTKLNQIVHVVELLKKEIFQIRHCFQSRLLAMAKDCLEKTYKLSNIERKAGVEKIHRIVIREYLETNFLTAWMEQGEEAALVELMIIQEDTDSESEPLAEKNEETEEIDVMKGRKRRRTAPAGKKLKKATPKRGRKSMSL